MALSSNCVLYRKLDESSWTSAADATGTWNTWTTTNITWATGKINNGWTFNWSSTEINTTWAVISGTWNFTIALWIKTSTAWKRLLQKRDSNASWFFIYTINDTGYQAYLDYNWSSFENNTSSTSTVNDWNWHLVWVSRNWSTITFWKDWVSNWWWSWTLLSLNTHKLVAWTDYVDAGKWFNWQMDEIWVWTRELTAWERTSLYNSWAWSQYPFASPSTTNPSFLLNML